MKHIFAATLRLDLDNADERRAWERLQQMDKRQYHSYGKLIAAAVNEYFDRQEKEAALLRAVEKAVERGLRSQPAPAPGPAIERDSEEDISAALDFADSF